MQRVEKYLNLCDPHVVSISTFNVLIYDFCFNEGKACMMLVPSVNLYHFPKEIHYIFY
jgi:hypothetical protein